MSDGGSFGFGVRVIACGTWGFAASPLPGRLNPPSRDLRGDEGIAGKRTVGAGDGLNAAARGGEWRGGVGAGESDGDLTGTEKGHGIRAVIGGERPKCSGMRCGAEGPLQHGWRGSLEFELALAGRDHKSTYGRKSLRGLARDH